MTRIMQRIGLALSGGGFRAAIYHLGVIRFLRDAGILPKISHVTSVSGGSVTAAHLVLNWDRYCGSPTEFDEAAQEIVRFVQLDVRNRIVRRFPFGSLVNSVGRLVRLPVQRQLSRPGMLEAHYRKYLFGETSLFQLPDRPRLHILATNLSEGGLCSFCKDGLLLQRRTRSQGTQFERVNFGLATVPMAVAASSAFPGFFPPLQVNGWDVGAEEGELSEQSFTDGGVIDNLGLRMFRYIEDSWVRDTAPLTADDFLEPEAVLKTLRRADDAPESATAMAHLRELLSFRNALSGQNSRTEFSDSTRLARSLWEIICSQQLYRDPHFDNVRLTQQSGQALLEYARSMTSELDWGDHLYLNRNLIDAVLEQAVGKPCLVLGRDGFQSILVSDAGAKFKIARDGQAGGIITTALRSSDIAMDRVYQLELEAARGNTTGVVFFPMADIVTREQDRTAPHPEVQRQASRIRTDMDRFSELEITALIQHGYCVARKCCLSQTKELMETCPSDPPWNPFDQGENEPRLLRSGPLKLDDESYALQTARHLQKSCKRKIWSTLFSFRDWPTYIYLPLILTLVFSVPIVIYRLHQSRTRQQMILSAVKQTSPLYNELLELLGSQPPTSLPDIEFNSVETLEPFDWSGFEVLSNSLIFDVRNWSRTVDKPLVGIHARMKVRRLPDAADNARLRFQTETTDADVYLQCHSTRFNPVLSRMESNGVYRWELALDLSKAPFNRSVEVVTDAVAQARSPEEPQTGRFYFHIPAQTSLVYCWVLMPVDREYENFEIVAYPPESLDDLKIVTPDAKVQLESASLASFNLINPQPGYRYECRWKWLDNGPPDQ